MIIHGKKIRVRFMGRVCAAGMKILDITTPKTDLQKNTVQDKIRDTGGGIGGGGKIT